MGIFWVLGDQFHQTELLSHSYPVWTVSLRGRLCIHHPGRLSSPGAGTFMSAFEDGTLLYQIFIFHNHPCHGQSLTVPSSIRLTPQMPHHPNIACQTPETALSVVKSVHYRLSGRLLPIPEGVDAINDLFRNHGAFYAPIYGY